MKADRLLRILLLLQRQEFATAHQLASQLKVTTRTVYRDMDTLSLLGIPVYAEPVDMAATVCWKAIMTL